MVQAIVLGPEGPIQKISLTWKDKGRPYVSASWMSMGNGNPGVEFQRCSYITFSPIKSMGRYDNTVFPSNNVCMSLTTSNTVQKTKMTGISQIFAIPWAKSYTVDCEKLYNLGVGGWESNYTNALFQSIHQIFLSMITLYVSYTHKILTLSISAAILKILLVLWDRVCPGVNDQFPISFSVQHFIWSESI